jgi:hypothetical protein
MSVPGEAGQALSPARAERNSWWMLGIGSGAGLQEER